MALFKNRPFLKMHGLGNDFVIVDGRTDGFVLDAARCLAIADRHRGVGFDQMIVLDHPVNPQADVFMHIFNADGSEAGACGNATRCVARLLFEEKKTEKGVVETVAGLLPVWREASGLIAADFGPPRLTWQEIPLAREVDTLLVPVGVEGLPPACCVNMGNPHAVFFMENVETLPVDVLGPQVERSPLFPDRTNVEFAQIVSPSLIRMRVWERGTGITQACGSGAAATFVAAVRRGLSSERATIRLDGGDLDISWRKADGHVILYGPAALSFRGVFEEVV